MTETINRIPLESTAGSRRRRFALSLGCCLVLWLAASSQARAQTATNAPLRVGVSPVFPPMVFKQGKELVGVEVELARALGKYLGRPVVFVELKWQDQIEALNDKRTDIIMSSMSITMARQYVVAFSQPYFITGQMALVRREDKNKYLLGFPPGLSGSVGVLKATTGEFMVQRDFPKSKIKVYENGEEAARALIRKRANLFIADSTMIWYLAGNYAADGLAVVPIALSEEKLAWAVRKSDDELLTAVNEFINRARADRTFFKIFSRWTSVTN